MPPAHLYVHTPYCHSKCPYCDFLSATPDRLPPANRYVDALLRDLESEPGPFTSLYVGGGTPTELPLPELERLLAALATRAAPNAEWTVEANPLSLTADVASLLRAHGVNRISIGFQSASDTALEKLGRAHRHRDNIAAVELIHAVGFPESSGDMIFGLPEDDLDATLDFLLGASLTHISAYELKIEGNSPWKKSGIDPSTDEDDRFAKMTHVIARLAAAGFRRYEISNFARPGHECLSHCNVWRSGEYAAVGAGAHGFVNGERTWQSGDVAAYLNGARRGAERVKDLAAETMFLGMRLVDGITLADLPADRRQALEAARTRLDALVADGMIIRDNVSIRPTEHGLWFVNAIGLRMMED